MAHRTQILKSGEGDAGPHFPPRQIVKATGSLRTDILLAVLIHEAFVGSLASVA
jgi:hypothetical protein